MDACTVFADTNAIVDLFYDQGGLIPNSRVSDKAPYHAFIGALWTSGKNLHISALVVMEMYGVFQKYDKHIFNSSRPKGSKVDDIKVFRSQFQDRADCKRRYGLITQQLATNPHIVIEPVALSDGEIVSYVDKMDIHTMDTNDYILTTMLSTENQVILTDDGDFCFPNAAYDIATNNRKLINMALSIGYTMAN